MPRYRRISEEVMVSRITLEGELQDPDFPISVTIERQEGYLTDGILGPMPWFKVSWEKYPGHPTMSAEVHDIAMCDVLAAKSYRDSDKFYLVIISDYDLGHNYERIDDERTKTE